MAKKPKQSMLNDDLNEEPGDQPMKLDPSKMSPAEEFRKLLDSKNPGAGASSAPKSSERSPMKEWLMAEARAQYPNATDEFLEELLGAM